MVQMKYGVSYGLIRQQEQPTLNPALEELMHLVGSLYHLPYCCGLYSVIFRECDKGVL